MLTRKSLPLFIILLLGLFGAACTTTGEGSAIIETPLAETAIVEPVLDPAALTNAFYEWYMAYTQTGNPLVDKAYHDSPYLSPTLVAEVDALLASFENGGYDPFLCAQDIPGALEVAGSWEAWREEDGTERGEAAVNVSQVWNPDSDFESVRDLTVYLVTVDGRWLINEIICPAPSEAEPRAPHAVVTAFYNWYLGYIGDPATEQFRNPLVDGAYRESGFLTAEFIDKVDEIIAGFNGGGYDPFLLAQDLPQAFSVDPGYLPDTAVVGLMFGESVKMVQVEFVEEGGRWLIDDIVEAVPPGTGGPLDTGDWDLFTDETYSFRFRYPAGWVVEALDMAGPGMPDDWPVVATYLLMPPDIADALAARSGPPDPNAPVIVAPIQLEIIVGDQAAFDRVHVTAAASETIIINGRSVVLHRYDPSVLQAVFQAPDDDQLWLVFSDMVSEFAGREELAAPVAGVFFAILETVTFD